MRVFRTLRVVAVAACMAMSLLLMMASGALAASPIYLCIGTKAAQGVKSGGMTGTCPKPTEKVTYAKVALPSEEAEQQKLLAILPYIKYVASGVGGKPTIQITGANLQILSGSGSTSGAVNGAGNLVIGYDENSGKEQTGSHDLILGEEQTFTAYGGILAGYGNTVSGPFASVTGGKLNTASGLMASVSGGTLNTANSAYTASVGGGYWNTASGPYASVTGGGKNVASGEQSSVSGGWKNAAIGTYSAILGDNDVIMETEFGHFP